MFQLIQILIISIVVAVISLTITKTKIFKWLRNFIKRKSDPNGSLAAIGKESLFYGLFTCPYCFSFYPSFFFVAGCGLRLKIGFTWFGLNIGAMDFIASWFCIVFASSLFIGLMYKSISQIK